MEEMPKEASAACMQFEGELQAHLEGESHPFILVHAQECRSCGALLADLQAIQQQAQALPSEEPSPALWVSVQARLIAEGIITAPGCRQFDLELPAFLEGEACPFIAAHAAECTACGSLLADVQSIREAARELPQEEPSRVVWANVRAQLEAEVAVKAGRSGRRWILDWRIFPQAVPLGVLAALVFLGSALTLPPGNFQRWGGTDEVATAQSPAPVGSLLPASEDGTLVRVVSELENSFKANEASMAPDLKATYEKSLVSLDGSIRECLDSLQHEPRNTLAHDYLLTAYTRKAEVLSSALEFEGR